MLFNFKKKVVIGVAITPELGLEVAQIDFAERKVLKYGVRQISYDNNRKEIADLDLFKEALQDLFIELDVQKGSEVVLTLPATVFKVTDYPASLTEEQVGTVIEEELNEHFLFKANEPIYSAVKLPNSTMQFNKIAYTASSKVMLIELAMQIKELGCTLIGIDTSVNASLNSLMYSELVNVSPDASWVMLLVENTCCRIMLMQGSNYVDSYEELIGIGEVLGDAENYSTVVSAVQPLLKNIPSQCLYVVSKTSVISAKILAEKLVYNAQIIHQEANMFSQSCLLEVGEGVDAQLAKGMTLDVIGASIFREFENYSNVRLNLFNSSLGNVYDNEQPPTLKFGSYVLKMSLENMVKLSLMFGIPMLVLIVISLSILSGAIAAKKAEMQSLTKQISDIQQKLDKHKDISTEVFDEGDEIRMGLVHNKTIFSYYQIVGTEIPKKLWLTSLELGKNITIEGQADNLESVYSFFRNIKDYNPKSGIKLQSLGLATASKLSTLSAEGNFDTDSILTTMNADFYQFRISDAPYTKKETSKKDKNDSKNSKGSSLPAGLEPLD